MKQLSIEEKAKRYDKVIKVATDIKAGTATYIPNETPVIDAIFPELKENEDERIKKRIIHALHGDVLEMSEIKEAVAWLEKQGEQKPANWLQELEDKLANATLKQLAEWKEKYFKEEPADNKGMNIDEEFINALGTMLNDGLPDMYLVSEERIKKSAELLFSIARKQLKNEMQEWSEEDNKIIEEIINDIECARAINYHAPKEGYEFRENWLKSLKDRVQPK